MCLLPSRLIRTSFKAPFSELFEKWRVAHKGARQKQVYCESLLPCLQTNSRDRGAPLDLGPLDLGFLEAALAADLITAGNFTVSRDAALAAD